MTARPDLPCKEAGCDEPRFVGRTGVALPRCKVHKNLYSRDVTRRRAERAGRVPRQPRPPRPPRTPRMLRAPRTPRAPQAHRPTMSPGLAARNRKIASGAMHVIADCRFGEGRWTTCTTCDVVVTGATDEQMADRWAEHVIAMKRARRAEAQAARGSDSGPTLPAEPDLGADVPVGAVSGAVGPTYGSGDPGNPPTVGGLLVKHLRHCGGSWKGGTSMTGTGWSVSRGTPRPGA